MKKSTLLWSLILSSMTMGPLAQAEVFELDSVIITATRSEKLEVDIPMSSTSITSEELQRTGSTNAQTALANTLGIAYKQTGPGGGHMGVMNSEIAIRGVANGTLVMVNGNPINARGKYFLDAIPAERIERIEIIKGGGSVLYGSEAMGGVINIITKKMATRSLHLGLGNYGQQNVDAQFGNEKVNFALHRERWGTVKNINLIDDYRSADAPKSQRDSVHFGYNFNDRLNFSYDYASSDSDYAYYFYQLKPGATAHIGDRQQYRTYFSKQYLYQLNYHDDSLSARLFYNRVNMGAVGPVDFDRKTHKKSSDPWYSTKELNVNYGLDVQKNWQISPHQQLIAGATYQHEFYDKSYTVSGDDKSRNIYALYAQWEYDINARQTITLSGRETWTGSATGGANYSNFSGGLQYLYRLNPDENLYLNISQSFIMPTFSQIYGSAGRSKPNPGLKPQHGINYEVGYKKIHQQHQYKLAAFHINISDNIKVDLKKQGGVVEEYQYINSDFRNSGIEAEMGFQGEGPWSYRVGIIYNNPQTKESGEKAKKPYWDRLYGRWQATGALTYQKGPWTSTLSMSYLADRVGTPSSSHSKEIKPYLLTTWNTSYQIDDQQRVSLRIDNLLDRNDIISHSGSDYRYTPFNYLLTYQYSF